eukprot:m.14966 g.14966  ORF g.14966 m.14966 type:complete len:73 (+) comp6470_c0_seq1:1611-1829(+)
MAFVQPTVVAFAAMQKVEQHAWLLRPVCETAHSFVLVHVVTQSSGAVKETRWCPFKQLRANSNANAFNRTDG